MRTIAMSFGVPPGCDSLIATIGRVNAAAISIGVFSRSRTLMLRSSMRECFDGGPCGP
ncbi:MAG TPA: hypothetical protein VFS26_08355 [Solirubrobacterales bacterium]|nr:hypothetical protein [Solirubrobacterales bacterium]